MKNADAQRSQKLRLRLTLNLTSAVVRFTYNLVAERKSNCAEWIRILNPNHAP